MYLPIPWDYNKEFFWTRSDTSLSFWNSNIFWMTLIFVVFIFLMIFFLDTKKLIIRHQKTIACALAFLTFVVLVVFFALNFIKKVWWYSLLQDLCPAISFISIPAFLYNKEKVYKALMPWLLIGAAVTMLGGEAKIFSEPLALITYFEHLLMLIKGLFAYVWIKKYYKKDFSKILIFPILLIAWIFFSGYIPWQITGDERWVLFSTALFEPSLGPGSAYEILNQIGIPYPWPTIIFYFLAVGFAFLIALNKNVFIYYFAWIIKCFKSQEAVKSKRVKVFLEKEALLKKQNRNQNLSKQIVKYKQENNLENKSEL